MAARYGQLIRALYENNAMFHQVKLGLRNMVALNAAMGDPTQHFQAVHVAGTNGKGSVSWKVARGLQAQGFRTGLFVSPHLACFRERVQVDGDLISEEAVEFWMPRIVEQARKHAIPATFFELVTQLAFCHFADSGVQFVSLETGLGGRLDSTNIVTPALSVITSVSLDHMRVLGDTVEEIATEKAGIIKEGVPVVLGPHACIDTTLPIAKARGSAAFVVVGDDEAALWSQNYDLENTAIAIKALAVLEEAGLVPVPSIATQKRVKEAVQTCPPCRFEVARVAVEQQGSTSATTSNDSSDSSGSSSNDSSNDNAGSNDSAGSTAMVLLDGAHNEGAFIALVKRLQHTFPDTRLRFVVGMSADKAVGSFLPSLARDTNTPAHRFHFVSAAHKRAAPAADLAAALTAATGESVLDSNIHAPGPSSVADGIHQALAAALRDADADAPTDSSAVPMSCHPEATTTQPAYSLAAARADLGDRQLVVICGSLYLMLQAREVLGYAEPRDDVQ